MAKTPLHSSNMLKQKLHHFCKRTTKKCCQNIYIRVSLQYLKYTDLNIYFKLLWMKPLIIVWMKEKEKDYLWWMDIKQRIVGSQSGYYCIVKQSFWPKDRETRQDCQKEMYINRSRRKYVDIKCLLCLMKFALTKKCCLNIEKGA